MPLQRLCVIMLPCVQLAYVCILYIQATARTLNSFDRMDQLTFHMYVIVLLLLKMLPSPECTLEFLEDLPQVGHTLFPGCFMTYNLPGFAIWTSCVGFWPP
jgi:hypothetical protein